MYGNISYVVYKGQGNIILSTWNPDGSRAIRRIPHQSRLFAKSLIGQGDDLSIYGEKLEQIDFRNSSERWKWLEDNPDRKVYECLNPVQEFLFDEYYGKNTDLDDFNKFPLRIAYIDIEIAVVDEFPNPTQAAYPINMITVYDTGDQKYHCFSLGKAVITRPDVEFRCYNSEFVLLDEFLKFWDYRKFHVVSGWNCIPKNQSCWLDDRIVEIQDVNIGNQLANKYGKITNKMETGLKPVINFTLVNNYKFQSSFDHIFEICSKEKNDYKYMNSLLYSKQDIKASDIQELFKEKDIYFKLERHKNINSDMTYKDFFKIFWKKLFQYDHFDIKIPTLKLINYLISVNYLPKTFSKKINYQYQIFSIKDKLDIIPESVLMELIDKTKYILVKGSGSHYYKFDIHQKISNDILQLLGFIFTDGFYSIPDRSFSICNKHEDVIKYYYNIMLNLNIFNTRFKPYKLKKQDKCFYKRFGRKCHLSFLYPMIYQNNNNKNLNLTMLSMLSERQFNSFFSGMIDGDGSVGDSSVSLCNYEKSIPNCIETISELLFWNGVSNTFNTKTLLHISCSIYNQNFISNLKLSHLIRSDNLKKLKYKSNTQSPRKILDKFENDKFIMLKLKNISVNEQPVEMMDITTESHYFLTKGIKTHNCWSFDIPYIHNRIFNMIDMGPDRALELSPLRKPARPKSLSFGGRSNRVFNGLTITGISQLDYMLLYMRYVIPIEGEKPSYTLNNVCLDEVGEGKTEHEGALKHLYKTDFQKFAEYNINDVELILKLDEKRSFMDLTRMLCSMCLIEHEKVFATSAMVTGGVLQSARVKGVRIPHSREPAEKKGSFKGAFVKPPELRRFKYGVTTFDVASLYPNIMIALNISPETLIGRVEESKEGKLELRMAIGGAPKEIDQGKLKTMTECGKYSLASNGALYRNDFEGLIPSFLINGFNERVRVKKEAARLEEEADKVEKAGGDSAEVSRLKAQSKRFKLEEKTRKIILNSTYGVCGSKYSPFYNLSNAEAVTLTGQRVIKMASGRIEEMVKEKYDKDWDIPIVVYNDTDSMHVDNEVIARQAVGDKPFKDNYNLLVKEIDQLTTDINTWCLEELPKFIPMRFKNRIRFNRECVCDAAYYFTKKHYFYHVINDEGKPEDKFIYKGIQVVSSSYPKFMKTMVKEIFKRTIKEDWTNDKYLEFMEDMYQKFKTLDFDDIAIYKGLSSYKESDGFLQAAKGTSGHARAALYYNQIIEKMGLKEKYNKVTSGKIRICHVDSDNPYMIDIIGFDDKIPAEFKGVFKPNYKKQFKLLFMSVLDDFCECNRWRQWNNLENYAVDIMAV